MKSTVLLFVLFAQIAQAQTAATTAPTTTPAPAVESTATAPVGDNPNQLPPEDNKVLEKIVITGSYIRQAVSEKSATPVTVVNQQKMAESGNFTAAGALRETAAFNQVLDGSTIALHGQGSADNLVLLNGLRLPKPNGGSAVNIDFLPAVAIERTEVLKDGASALYGSEALAGVVNFVTKKNYEGYNFFARTSYPEIGADQDTTIGLTAGKNFGKTNILGIFQYRRKEPVYWSDFSDYYGLRDVKGFGTLQSPYGNLRDPVSNQAYRSPNCPSDLIGTGGTCRYDYLSGRQYHQAAASTGGEERDYYTGFLSINTEVNKALKFEFTNFYVVRNAFNQSNPVLMTLRDETALGGNNYSIPAAIADSWNPINAVSGAPAAPFGNSVNLQYSALEELGPRLSERDTHNAVSQARIHGQVGSWDWEASTGYGYTYYKDTVIGGNANKDALHTMIVNSQFNPFKPSGAKDDLSSVKLQSWSRDKADILDTKIVLAGPLFNIGENPLNLAVGGEGQWISFKRENDPFSLGNKTIAGQATNQTGQREVTSAFMELGYSPFKALEIQLAGRFDSYDDVGETINPKIGLSYHASDKVTFRTSYGTGFKAPDMISVYQGTRTNQASVRDEVVCKNKGLNDPNCASGIYPVTTYGNRNLKPETASHYNVGMIVTPQPKLVMVLDYWSVDGADGLSTVDPEAVIRNQARSNIPAPAEVVVNRDGDGYITSISHPTRLNGAIFKIRGIDIKIEKQFTVNPLGLGAYEMRIQMDHSHLLSSGGNDSSTDPFTKQFNLSYINILGLSFAKGDHFTKISGRTYNGGDYNTDLIGIGAGSTYTFTEVDIHHEWFLSENSSVNFGVKDLFNTQPVAYKPGFNLTSDASSFIFGRTFYLGYNHDF